MPEASGSRVPAWPAFLALKARFTTETACVEVMPTPLSSTSQPLTSRFLGRGSRGGRPGAGVSSSITASLIRLIGRLRHVPPHFLAPQQRVDARGLVEALVAAEAQVGGEFKVDAGRHLMAQVLPVALERL